MNNVRTERLIIRPFSLADLEEAHQMLDVDLQWSGPSFVTVHTPSRYHAGAW